MNNPHRVKYRPEYVEVELQEVFTEEDFPHTTDCKTVGKLKPKVATVPNKKGKLKVVPTHRVEWVKYET